MSSTASPTTATDSTARGSAAVGPIALDPIASAPADLRLASRSSSLGATVALARLLARPTLAQRSTWTLPVLALAVVNALVLTVTGGALWFFRAGGELAGLYRMFAVVAVLLLVIPLASLAGAAARLSAARRDERLSSLRLVGATTATVRLLTLAETAALALVGAVLGLLGHVALTPLVGRLHFLGHRVTARGLWPGVLPVAGVLVGMVVLSLVSAAVSLRRVEISPLGVRTRQEAPRMHWLRAVLGIGAIIGASVAAGSLRMLGTDQTALVVGVVIALGVPLLAVNLLGPWVVRLLAALDARRAKGAVGLLAARQVLDDPRLVWRQVGGLAMTTFVAVVLGVAMSYATRSTADDAILAHDLQLGVQLTLAIAFVTVACSVTITQLAALQERRHLYVALDLVGTPLPVLDAARRRAVLRPLVSVVGVSLAAALLVVVPMAGHGHLTDPVAPLTTLALLVLGVLLVVATLLLTRRSLAALVAGGVARSE